MREIKFRARNAEVPPCWIYGYFVQKWGVNYIINNDGEFKVIAGTQCEFTGMHDMDNREIYPGDVIPVDGKNYEVIFNTTYCCYSLWSEKHSAGVFAHLLDARLPNGSRHLGFPLRDGELNTKDLRVIGDKFENPELLEVA